MPQGLRHLSVCFVVVVVCFVFRLVSRLKTASEFLGGF